MSKINEDYIKVVLIEILYKKGLINLQTYNNVCRILSSKKSHN